MNIILIISLFIGVGYIFGKLASLIKLPTVSGYLIAGLLLGLLPIDYSNHTKLFNNISEITLSFIAFGIGSEFILTNLKKSGKTIMIITLLEVIGAILVVFLAMFLLVPLVFPNFTASERLVFSLILGTMSAATAPAATIMVIKQFRTKGPLTDTILPVTALDDVFGIVAFGIALPIARILTPIDPANALDFTLWNIIKMPLFEVFGSLILGLLLGIALSFLVKRLDPKDELQVKSIFFILLGLGLANLLGLSPLLVNIVLGATIANLRDDHQRSFRAVNDFVPVFYILFFTIAGATLNLKVLTTVGLIGIVYVLARGIGKISGVYAGGKLGKADPRVTKYLGIALLPQGGISIGLSILVTKYLPTNLSAPIVAIILFSILIYESSGPIFAKIALSQANELYMNDINDDLELESNAI